ncbi:GGDEF domain-containing phosphodiesterase [Ferrimonas lipolytica]|uniref:EAL domain-containing protein n=1 Tax=Ferrimonas lipolytica TaxID=2724191 RepID=A0A6H1UIY9_9GAMM|nr:GGDEF domain-containing phosphodiesterase [Ferrimonas lipolytica]QIZ78273.1 EAL domain-containing protein [Ferrimonas lipolytica]
MASDHRISKYLSPKLSLLVCLPLALMLCLSALVLVDFLQGRDMMRNHLHQAQQRLLLQQARQIEQLLAASGTARIRDVAEQSLLSWSQDKELLEAAIIDREQRIYLGSSSAWRGGQAQNLLDGFESELARQSLLSGHYVIESKPERASVQIYYPLQQLKLHLEPRLIYLEQDLTGLNSISKHLFIERLVKLWSIGLVLVGGMVWLSYRTIIVPLKQITEASRRLGEADLPPPQLGPIAELHKFWHQLYKSNNRVRKGYLQLVTSEQRWLYAIEGMKVGVWDWHVRDGHVYLSHHWKAMLGYRDDELSSSYDAWEQRIHPEDKDRTLALLKQHLDGQSGIMESVIRLRHRDGHYIWVMDRGMVVDWDSSGKASRMVGSHVDITDEMNRKLQGADDDQAVARLGLVNSLIPLVRTDDGVGYSALFFLDIDDFKLVNDSFSHLDGDQLLKQVLVRIKKRFGHASLIHRLHGDEFVVLIGGIDPHQQPVVAQVNLFAEQLMKCFERPWVVNGTQVYLGTCIGISVFQPSSKLDPEVLLSQAELAVYQCKELGRGSYRLFSNEVQQKTRQRYWLRDSLSRGLAQGELNMHYQPVLDSSGELHAAEALIRWYHPERGEIPPGQFLPVAERYGLAEALAELQLATACRDLAVLRRYGLDEVMLNVSLRQLSWPQFVSRLEYHLELQGLAPQMLVLEISEYYLPQLTPETISVLEKIKALNVRIAIDHFGAGYLMLSQLQQLPISQIKLDARYLRHQGDSSSEALLLAQANVAKTLSLEWMASGVDEESCYQMLRQHGCQRFQGHLLSAPRSLDELLVLLRHRGRAGAGAQTTPTTD